MAWPFSGTLKRIFPPLPQTWRTSVRLLITLANMLRFCWLRNFPYGRLVIFMTLVAIALGLQALEVIKEAEALVERFSHSADRRTILPICKGDGDASKRVWENLIARSDT